MSKIQRDRMSMSVYGMDNSTASFLNDFQKERKSTAQSSMVKNNGNLTDIELDFEEIDEDEEYEDTKGKSYAKSSKIASKVNMEVDPSNYSDEYHKLTEDPIFHNLKERSQFKDDPDCNICRSKFSLMKKKKNCKFCGECVCDEHSKKKRPNPQNLQDKTDVHRVCDSCDKKYIIKIVLSKNYGKAKEYDTRIASVTGDKKAEEKRKAEILQKIGDLEKQENAANTHHSQKIAYLLSEKSKKSEEIKAVEQKMIACQKEHEQVKGELKDAKNIFAMMKHEFENMKQEATEYNHKIEAKRLDIDVLNRQIRQMDEALNKSKRDGDTSDVVADSFLVLNESIMNVESFISERRSTLPNAKGRKNTKGSRAESDLVRGGCNINCSIF